MALVTSLLGAPPSERLRRLIDGAHGNPFPVMVDEGVAETSFHGLPPTLRQTVPRRVRDLSPDALGILQAAAVLGGPFDLADLADLAAMVERSPVSLHADVLLALEVGPLEEHGARLRFHHDLIREAIYAHMPAAIQASLHDQAVRALTARHAPATEVARLFVSRRTVETHVGHLYAKLGMRGRVAIARFEHEQQPPRPD